MHESHLAAVFNANNNNNIVNNNMINSNNKIGAKVDEFFNALEIHQNTIMILIIMGVSGSGKYDYDI